LKAWASEARIRQLENLGFTTPQAQAIPQLLAGRDMVVDNLNGTGKTQHFLPMLEQIDIEHKRGKL